MRHCFVTLTIVCSALAVPTLYGEESPSLRVMTYNLRYASDTPPNAWPDRLPVALEMLREYQPDIIGTQEALYRQVKDFEASLPAYRWIGLGREGGSRGEFMAVFYRPDRLEPLEFDHFWLSDTPDVIGSSTWGNSNRRMVTWIQFRDRMANKDFYFFNTHFDHEIQEAREKSAALVRERIGKLPEGRPVILVGDFNAAHETNPVYHRLVGPDAFVDTWTMSDARSEWVGTFHGYGPPVPNGARIDWILTRGPISCARSEIVTFSENGQRPSDHFPVIADLRIE